MKVKQLLFAGLLLSGMTAFNACSSDEIDNVTPPTEKPAAEELETVLTFGVSLDNNVETRADDISRPSDQIQGGVRKEKIRNYALAIFALDEEGNPSNCIAIDSHVILNGENADAQGNDNLITENRWGFYLKPVKIKTSEKKIAYMVVANCDELLADNGNEPTKIGTYQDFITLCEEKGLFLNPMVKGNTFDGYPLSSNVITVDNIQPGKYNLIGESGGTEVRAKELLEKEGYANVSDKSVVVAANRIFLYRCWAQVELTSISLKSFNGGKATFIPEAVFIANIPVKTKLFNSTAIPVAKAESTWGKALGYGSLDDFLGNDLEYHFYTGLNTDDFGKDDNGNYIATVTEEQKKAGYISYRSRKIANATTNLKAPSYYERLADKVEALTASGSEASQPADLTKVTVDNYTGADAGVLKSDKNPFCFIIPESSYSKAADGSLITDQAMVLVVKGKYTEESGNMIPGNGESSYYTVVINGETNTTTNTSGIAAHKNEVVRNVKYELDLTITGPGSPRWDVKVPTSVMVTKCTIVPFGHVKQSAEVD